jgi:PAS domain S-box-containing protein
MSRPASQTQRLLVLGAEAPDPLCATLQESEATQATDVEVGALEEPASAAEVEDRLTSVDCALVAEGARHWVETGDDRTPPVVLLVEEFSTVALEHGVETDVEAFLPREAVSEAPGLVADRIGDILQETNGRQTADRHYRQALGSANDAIVVHDAETGRLVDANEAFCDLVGYDRATVLELGTAGLGVEAGDSTRLRAEDILNEVRETGGAGPFEWEVETADGERRLLEVTTTRATVRGRLRHLSMVRDVTERRELERSYQAVFDTVAATVSVHAPGDPEILDANRTLCDLLGYDRETLVGTDTREVTAVDRAEYDADRIERLHRRAVESETPVETQWPLKTADGETRWLDLTLTTATLRGETRVVVTGRDVTERRRREREYEQIFDGVNDVVAVHDPDSGEMVDVNATMCELTGYDRETVLDRGATGLLVDHPGADFAPERVPEIIDRVMAGEEVAPYEQVVEASNGEQVWLEVNPTRATIGGEERFLAISRDVTERKRREREFEQIFNAVDDPITIHDPETAEHVRVNDGFCELLGYSRDEIMEMGIEGYSPTEEGYTVERAREFVRSVVDGGGPREMEWVVETSEGERRWLQVKGTTAEIGGELRFVSIDRDVTEQHRREREYEQIFDGVNDAIAVHDPDTGEIIDVNDSYLHLFGHDRERILEEGIDGLSVTEEGYTADRARALIREVAATDADETVEWRVETADGERRTVESSLTVAEVGGERRVLSMIRDVTERKRREREYAQIFDGVNDAITVHDPDTAEMLAVNETFCEIVGYDRETVLDMEISEFSRDDRGYTTERGREFIRAVGESGEPDQMEWALETADGETRWVEVHGAIAEIDGERRFLAIDRDITEAKRREREFEQIFDGVNDAITVHDPDTAEILRANEPYLELLGYESAERLNELGIGGLSATDEGYTAEAGRQLIREATREGPMTVEWRAERADGERLWLEATLTPGEVGGEPRVISIQRDVTDRKRREQQLAVFNRVLRHNLRNRVDVIRSHAETLRSDADEAVVKHAERIIENADRLATLSARVRDADRLLRRDPRPRGVALSETVRNVVDDVVDGETDLTVRTALPSGVTVRTDEEALRMVLRSALSNAVEYATSAVEVGAERTDDGVTLRVDDDGPGIPAGELEALEAGTESMLQHSRGLGLWRIRWGTELLNGRLSFDVDNGTTVTVTLPDRSDGEPTGG